jgi:hypothetical protein
VRSDRTFARLAGSAGAMLGTPVGGGVLMVAKLPAALRGSVLRQRAE